MLRLLSFAAVLLLAANGATAAVDYTTVCNSSKLLASDRHECRVQMTAAMSDEVKQAEIHRVYLAKIDRLLSGRPEAPRAATAAPTAPSNDR